MQVWLRNKLVVRQQADIQNKNLKIRVWLTHSLHDFPLASFSGR